VSGFDVPQNRSQLELGACRSEKGNKYRVPPRLNALVGKRQLNGILSLYSGVPFDVTVDGEIANTDDTYELADLVLANPHPSNKSRHKWLNPAAVSVQPNHIVRTVGRNPLRTAPTK